MPGETGSIDVSLPIAMLIAGFFAVAIFNTVEITLNIFSVFRRKQGLYFWSLLVATFGIFIHTIAVFLRFFALAPNLPMCVVTVVGWWAMVTGQSVVLYSRLGLIVADRWKTRLVAVMIVFNFVVLHIPVSILFLASNSGNPDPFVNSFIVYEKIQLAGFFLQESIISGLYVWEAATGLKPILAVKATMGRRVLRHLRILFVLTVLLDASLLATEYSGNFQIQTTYKPVVYSIKLKIEFVILNELVRFELSDERSACVGRCPPHPRLGGPSPPDVTWGSRCDHTVSSLYVSIRVPKATARSPLGVYAGGRGLSFSTSTSWPGDSGPGWRAAASP
ncbi:hypothetical protein Micbo1qcDRAFT_190965 [Microdochium bolleyi]|uniref:DUF7703 domain-containing protein n=1 Tax=Microdochium bolleyi TaxID=196109 RepID=A0A136ILB6_9PEZI|nr:hypothetical protein Micbo1qcDRAFT_190965 [Microdochium bolleyi]